MRKKTWFLIIIFLLCVFAGSASAQDVFVADMKISTTNATPNVDGVYHVIEGADFNYEIRLVANEDNIDVLKCEYTVFLGTESVKSDKIEGGFNNGVDSIPLGILKVGEYEYGLQVKIEYNVKDDELPKVQEISTNHKIKVWEPIVFPKTYEAVKCALPDSTIELGIDGYSGGNESGWVFKWSEGDSKVDNYSFKATNVEREESKDIELNIKNIAPDNTTVWGDTVYKFNVTVYPTISVEQDAYDKDVYYGDSVTLGVSHFGGKSDGWSFEWVNILQESKSSYSYNVRESDTTMNVATYKVIVTNTYKETGDWYRNEFVFTINEWSRGDVHWNGVTDVLSDSVNQFLTFEEGYTDGWEIKWHIDGKEQTEFARTETSCMFENHSSACVEKMIEVDIRNCINDERVGYANTFSRKINVWPRVSLPSMIDNAETFIREGDVNELSVIAATGGYYTDYEKTWFYTWYRNDCELDANGNKCAVKETTDNAGHKKFVEKVVYTLNVSNLSPQGQIWVSKDIPQHDVFVYRRPKTPLKLQRKGNGTSCMFIISSEYSDDELAEYEYEFIYGYTDVYGVEHMSESTTNRYFKFDDIIYNDPSNTFWVLAQWRYDDALVTSGRCFANGQTDEDYNASVFGSTTRGAQTSVNKVNDADFCIIGNRLKAEFTETVTLRINVYSLTGTLVKELHYPSSSSFNEVIDLDGLSRGIYVLEACAGDMHIINKVVVE